MSLPTRLFLTVLLSIVGSAALATDPFIGKAGNACTWFYHCDKGLKCVGDGPKHLDRGICSDPHAAAGQAGGACREGGQCDGRLSCLSSDGTPTCGDDSPEWMLCDQGGPVAEHDYLKARDYCGGTFCRQHCLRSRVIGFHWQFGKYEIYCICY